MFLRMPKEFFTSNSSLNEYRTINLNSSNTNQIYNIQSKLADVNGDGLLEIITLKGKKPYSDSPFFDDLIITITNTLTGVNIVVTPKTDAGYGPHLFVGKFSKNTPPQVLLFIDSGGSGGISYSYIYSFKDNIEKLIFDYEKFNENNIYNATYEDYFKVKVQSENDALKGIIDLTAMRNLEYLSQLYDTNGKLKNPAKGDALPLGGVSPLSINGTDTFKLLTNQRIIGLYNADTLGWIESILELSNGNFNTVITRLVINMEKTLQ